MKHPDYLVVGLICLAGGGFLAIKGLLSLTRPLWSRHVHVKKAATIPKSGKKPLNSFGKVLNGVVATLFTIFVLSVGGLIVASSVSPNSVTGWLALIALLSVIPIPFLACAWPFLAKHTTVRVVDRVSPSDDVLVADPVALDEDAPDSHMSRPSSRDRAPVRHNRSGF